MMGNIDIYIITKITFVSQTLNIIYSKNKKFILEFGEKKVNRPLPKGDALLHYYSQLHQLTLI